jgi:hypothetical protein
MSSSHTKACLRRRGQAKKFKGERIMKSLLKSVKARLLQTHPNQHTKGLPPGTTQHKKRKKSGITRTTSVPMPKEAITKSRPYGRIAKAGDRGQLAQGMLCTCANSRGLLIQPAEV